MLSVVVRSPNDIQNGAISANEIEQIPMIGNQVGDTIVIAAKGPHTELEHLRKIACHLAPLDDTELIQRLIKGGDSVNGQNGDVNYLRKHYVRENPQYSAIYDVVFDRLRQCTEQKASILMVMNETPSKYVIRVSKRDKFYIVANRWIDNNDAVRA